MKKKIIYLCSILLILVVFLLFGYGYLSKHKSTMESKTIEMMEYYFHQPQWKRIHFSNKLYDGNIAPSISKEMKEDEVIEASRAAGIENPVLPVPEDIPEGAQFYSAALGQGLEDGSWYQLRFYLLADEEEKDKLYSIWVAAVPSETSRQNGFTPTGDEFIYSVLDTPDKIKEDMAEYFK